MNNREFFIYLLIMAGSTYLIRAIPFALIRRRIKSPFINSFLYQYTIKKLIGVEIGPTFNFCLGGKDKSKIGNMSPETTKYEKGTFNPFELGIAFGIFTSDLGQSSFNHIFST